MSEVRPDSALTPDEARLLAVLEDRIRSEMDGALTDPRLVVLQGLLEAGEGGALTEAEQMALARSAPELAAAREAHPGLDAAVREVAREADLFNAAWNDAETAGPGAARATTSMRWPARIGLGVSALVLLVIVWFAGMEQFGRTVTTAGSLTEVVLLEDGSSVRLAPGSRLTYQDGRAFNRSVELEGRAFFDVVPGSEGFTVVTAEARTTVLGTRFGVDAGAGATRVVLVSGRVAVAGRTDRDRVLVLEPGQQTLVDRGGAPGPVVVVDPAVALPWSDLLIFRDTPMGVVAERLGEARHATIRLGDGLESLEVTGTFRPDQSTREVLDILAATLDAVVSQEGDVYTLSSR